MAKMVFLYGLFITVASVFLGCSPASRPGSCEKDDDCAESSACKQGSCVEVQCKQDSDCDSNQHCENYQCRAVDGCNQESDCEGDEICENGQCVQVDCKLDSDCLASQSCIDHECIAVECRSDDQCDVGKICLKGQCVEGCVSQRDCPDGTVCDVDEGEHGLCVQCILDTDCEQGLRCMEHMCRQYCTSDDDCDDGFCDTHNHMCIECSRDDQCELGYICQDQVCMEGCRKDRDCPLEHVCESGSCLPGCHDDSDCGGKVCDEATQSCVECVDRTDCVVGNLCIDSFCVPGCQQEEDCPVGMNCYPDVGPHGSCLECRADEDCALDEYCSSDMQCETGCRSEQSCDFGQLCVERSCSDAYSEQSPFCKPCSSQDLSSCGSRENACLIYPYTNDEFSQESGEYCALGCSDDQPCPNGFECRPVITVKQSDICHQDQDCPGGLPCLKAPGAEKGYCPCHDTYNPCPENSCIMDTCGSNHFCTMLYMNGIQLECETSDDCNVCNIGLQPCALDGSCPAIQCESQDGNDYGGCVIDRACSLTEGTHCPI